MFYRTIPTLALLGLAACGGTSSGNVTVTPISPSGFASDTLALNDVTTLNLTDQRRIVSDGTEELSLAVQDITLDQLFDDDGVIEIVIDGQTFNLIGPEDDGDFVFEDDTNFIRLIPLDLSQDDVFTYRAFALLDGNLNAASIVIGLDTDPDIIGSRSGSATFSGFIDVTTRTGFVDGFGGGNVALDVDFDTMILDGELSIFDTNNSFSETEIPNVTFDISATDIAGNGFETDLIFNPDESIDDIDGTIVSAGINGRFYGADGAAIGGQVFGEIDNGDDEFATLIEGTYVATE